MDSTGVMGTEIGNNVTGSNKKDNEETTAVELTENANLCGVLKKTARSKKKRRNDEAHEKPPKEKRKASSFRAVPKSSPPEFVTTEHKNRLRALLKRLMANGHWDEASGVLSVLLKATDRERLPNKNRQKYWAAMELLRQIGGIEGNCVKAQNIYDIRAVKQPIKDTTWSRPEAVKRKYLIRLEKALLYIMESKFEEASNETIFMMQEPSCKSDPIVNFVHGLIRYLQCYSRIPEELELTKLNLHRNEDIDVGDPFCNLYSATCNVENDMCKLESAESNCSESSVGDIEKDDPDFGPFALKEHVSQGTFIPILQQETSPDHSDFSPREGRTVGPLPICLDNLVEQKIFSNSSWSNRNRDNYADAVKHLRIALSSDPPLLAALLPLTQLLLIDGEVAEAIEVSEHFSPHSNHLISLRLKAYLMAFHDPSRLTACHENILESDPSSRDSLVHLTKMHKAGRYTLELLTESIALHLDATLGTCYLWGIFASSLHEVHLKHCSGYQEDQFSTDEKCDNKNGTFSKNVKEDRLPEMFSNNESRKSWKLRCRWWSTRHFSCKTYESELEAGHLQLLAFKAASAAHLFGRSFRYVDMVYHHMVSCGAGEYGNLLLLRQHMEHTLNLQKKLEVK